MSVQQAAGDWRDRQVSARAAVSVVKPGDRVFVGSACSTPLTLVEGLGRVPNEMLAHLINRRGLAIHSDVITEPLVNLVESGVVTGPVVTSWAMGSRRLYDLVDRNSRFAFHPIDYVCDPVVVANRKQMVSVTQAFSIDLTGQVSTEMLDGVGYGGISTGPAFHRGALESPDGMTIICLASQTPAGRSAALAVYAPTSCLPIEA